MTAVQIILKAAGLRTLWLSVASVAMGTAAAAAHGSLDPIAAMACLLFAVFAQCTSNVIHRYYDDKHNYGENRDDNMYCEDIDRPVSYILKEGIQIFSILTATAGLAVLSMAGWWALIIAALIVFFALINNIGPYPLSRSVLYPIATFFIFGPIAVIGTELVQSKAVYEDIFTWWNLEPAIIMSVMLSLMASNCHIIYAIFHLRRNALTSRTTFFGRYGKTGATIVLVLSTIIYCGIGLIAPFELEIVTEYFIYLPVPVLSMLLSFVTIHYARTPGKCLLAWRMSLVNIVVVALLTLIVFCIIGYPDGYTGN